VAVVTSGATSDDVVLVKASNAVRLWQVAEALVGETVA
jgi:UDP-N-acetylmuramyl pentapeptide synthase